MTEEKAKEPIPVNGIIDAYNKICKCFYLSGLEKIKNPKHNFDEVEGKMIMQILEAYKESAVKEANQKIREQIKRVLKTKEEGSYESTADFITDLEYYTSEEYLTSDMTN